MTQMAIKPIFKEGVGTFQPKVTAGYTCKEEIFLKVHDEETTLSPKEARDLGVWLGELAERTTTPPEPLQAEEE